VAGTISEKTDTYKNTRIVFSTGQLIPEKSLWKAGFITRRRNPKIKGPSYSWLTRELKIEEGTGRGNKNQIYTIKLKTIPFLEIISIYE